MQAFINAGSDLTTKGHNSQTILHKGDGQETMMGYWLEHTEMKVEGNYQDSNNATPLPLESDVKYPPIRPPVDVTNGAVMHQRTAVVVGLTGSTRGFIFASLTSTSESADRTSSIKYPLVPKSFGHLVVQN